MRTGTDGKVGAAARAWRLMFGILVASSEARAGKLAQRGLTPNDARALWSLDMQNGRPIGELARQWGCDPSNATFIVDRLERAGLAERRASPDDRRVKLVVLTPAGAATKSELDADYHRPPPEILRLSQKDLQTLERILTKAQPPAIRHRGMPPEPSGRDLSVKS